MKHSQSYSFSDVLRRLSLQAPEEKLRSAFHLTDFVNKLRKEGARYGKEDRKQRTGKSFNQLPKISLEDHY